MVSHPVEEGLLRLEVSRPALNSCTSSYVRISVNEIAPFPVNS